MKDHEACMQPQDAQAVVGSRSGGMGFLSNSSRARTAPWPCQPQASGGSACHTPGRMIDNSVQGGDHVQPLSVLSTRPPLPPPERWRTLGGHGCWAQYHGCAPNYTRTMSPLHSPCRRQGESDAPPIITSEISQQWSHLCSSPGGKEHLVPDDGDYH